MLLGMAAGAAGVAAASPLEAMAAALAGRTPPPPLVWVNDGGDDHNHLALLGLNTPSFLNLVTVLWDVRDYPPLLPTGYIQSNEPFTTAPVLIMEALPDQSETGALIEERVRRIVPQAKVAILLGSDACFGGIGIDAQAVSRFEALCKKERTPVIKLPGVPVPPHHLLGVLNHLEFFGFPRLDGSRRPVLYYGETVCQNCEHRDDLEIGRFAKAFAEGGCLLRLGCKGPITHNSCSTARWNGGENWCVGAGGPCTGCSEPGFPDHGGLGLYGAISGAALQDQSSLLQNVESLGLGLMGLAAAGIGLHLVRNALAPEDEESRRKAGGGEGD